MRAYMEAELSAGVWTDISQDVLISAGVRASRGIQGSGPDDRTASPGRMSFSLNNSASNSGGLQGYYSPGHVNCRTGFGHGTKVRLSLLVDRTDEGAAAAFGGFGFGDLPGEGETYASPRYYVFCGTLRVIAPEPGIYGTQRTACIATDYMDVLAEYDDLQLALAEGDAADDLVADVLALVDAPANQSVATGSDTLAFAWDDLGGGGISALGALDKIARTEGGYIYVTGDETDGETFVFEARGDRLSTSSLATLTQGDFKADPSAFVVPSSLDRVFNDIEVEWTPRRQDAAATTVLVSLDNEIEVADGETETVWADYRDPDQEAVAVGGKDMVAPVATTDVTLNTASGGGGTDETSEINSGTPGDDFSVDCTFFGSSVKIELINDTGGTRYVRGPGGADGMQIRGKGLYRYAPVRVRYEDSASIAQFGRRRLSSPLSMPYQSNQNVALALATLLADLYSGLGNVPERMRLLTEVPSVLNRVYNLDIGDRVTVSESLTAVDSRDVIINAVEYEITQGVLGIWWTVAPADETQALILDDPVLGLLDTGALGFG